MRARVRRSLDLFWRVADRLYYHLLIRAIEIAFGLGFLVWFIVSSRLTGGKL